VYDMQQDNITARLPDHYDTFPTPNFVDISPSGKKVILGTCKESGDAQEPWNGHAELELYTILLCNNWWQPLRKDR